MITFSAKIMLSFRIVILDVILSSAASFVIVSSFDLSSINTEVEKNVPTVYPWKIVSSPRACRNNIEILSLIVMKHHYRKAAENKDFN